MKPERICLSRGFVLFCMAFLTLASCAATAVSIQSKPVLTATPAAETPFEVPTRVGQISLPGEVQELVPGGAIDWSGMTVRARGTGVLDPGNSNRDQAWQMAEQAAAVVAQRNLLEIVKGVRVDSDTRIQEIMAANDTVSRRIDATVRMARRHGQAKYDSVGGTVEVELECDLCGAAGVENALTALPPAEPGIAGLSDSARDFLRQYSGLVLDGVNTGLKPSLFPRIYDENGNLLFDPREYLIYQDAPGDYAVQFVARLDQVLASPDFAKSPLVLKVRQVRGKLGTDVVLGRADADNLSGMKEALHTFLVGHRIFVRLTS